VWPPPHHPQLQQQPCLAEGLSRLAAPNLLLQGWSNHPWPHQLLARVCRVRQQWVVLAQHLWLVGRWVVQLQAMLLSARGRLPSPLAQPLHQLGLGVVQQQHQQGCQRHHQLQQQQGEEVPEQQQQQEVPAAGSG
jgi:hypothetical protein